MADLYPLLLRPEFKERIWGTRDLSPIYGEAPGTAPIGEVWLTGDECRVTNGPLAGATLGELCKRFGRDLVGETARDPDRFPLLIKFLFPREKLSVQVHPDDDMAKQIGEPCGKTECWYVLKAEPGAQVGLGLKPGTTREQFAQAIREVRAEQSLNWIDIHEGEMIYVDAGTVHAIGPGSILVETQQNSDTTYRLYDYGRPRELHVEQGLRVMKEKTSAGKIAPSTRDDFVGLIVSPCFVVSKWSLRPKHFVNSDNSDANRWLKAGVLVGLNGCGVVRAQGAEPITFGRGDVVVLPATVGAYSVHSQWDIEYLTMMLPPVAPREQ